MSSPFIAEIRLFSFGFPPKGWANCNGQLLPINQNQALFSLLGTTYGGNGTTNFALPNLQSRLAVHQSPSYAMGQMAGVESVTLLQSNLPSHTHTALASNGATTTGSPTNANWVAASTNYATPASAPMAAGAIGLQGGNQPHENRAPSLALNYSIALQGIFPSRN